MEPKQLQLAGIIDTGFAGFIQIPFTLGLLLGLCSQPFDWGETKLANNSTQKIICKEVKVSVGNESRSGICNIPLVQVCPILIGMDFLRCFDKMLIVSFSSGIYLVPDRDLTKS